MLGSAPGSATAQWPTCEHPSDPPCAALGLSGFGRCLFHLDDRQRETYFNRLKPLADVDLRGTRLSESLVRSLCKAMADREGRAVFGAALFGDATFTGEVGFAGAKFGRLTDFSRARFESGANFTGANFTGPAYFVDARFGAHTEFEQAQFGAHAFFGAARFRSSVSFGGVTFHDTAWLGPLVAKFLNLESARFAGPAEIAAEAHLISGRRARFNSTLRLGARFAAVDLHGAVFGGAASVFGSERPFVTRDGVEVNGGPEELEPWPDPDERAPAARLMSVRLSDVGNLLLTDIDLSWCLFAGAHRLEQLKIEGRCPLNSPPATWRWTRRQTLAEEYLWRDWPVDNAINREARIGPERVAPLYRAMRKAFEDSKNEAGAGDFYYGEMEARRRSATTRRAERWILWAYWLLSGYGQRAGRALLGVLLLLMIVTGMLIGWGLPVEGRQEITGTVQLGQATLALVEPPAVLPPAGQRWTAARTEKAVQVALGALVFRDSSQRLTPTGTWIVMVARIGGPLLLALAILAIRARVKR